MAGETDETSASPAGYPTDLHPTTTKTNQATDNNYPGQQAVPQCSSRAKLPIAQRCKRNTEQETRHQTTKNEPPHLSIMRMKTTLPRRRVSRTHAFMKRLRKKVNIECRNRSSVTLPIQYSENIWRNIVGVWRIKERKNMYSAKSRV